MSVFKKYIYAFTALAVTLTVLGGMLLPGYILSLDMVFGPFNQYSPQSTGGFLNSSPLWYFMHLLYLLLPGWILEKGMLVALVFLLSFLSLTFLPLGGKAQKRFEVRLFASLLYTANPFVYERLLAGHWAHLFAYALLPVVLNLLFFISRKPEALKGVQLAAVLALVGLFSLHLFVMAILMSALWLVIAGATKIASYKLQVIEAAKIEAGREDSNVGLHEGRVRGFIVTFSLLLLTLLVLTSYWSISALTRSISVEKSFDVSHWQAFAAAPHGNLPVLMNLSAMGGYWGEAYAWAQYFRWPQENILFWFAYVLVMLLAGFGVYAMCKRRGKSHAVFCIVLGLLAIIFAAGVSATPFASVNYWLYVHLPFWSGFRDSQKFIALYALAIAVLAGNGFGSLLRRVEARNEHLGRFLATGALLVPLFFGVYMWGGFTNQLRPVWYPPEWYQARSQILADPKANVLILPWQGYLSLGFNHNLIVANPAGQFFGRQAVVSQNVRVGKVYDESASASYTELDQAIRHNSPASGESMAQYLLRHNIQYIIFFQDIASVDSFSYSFLHSKGFILEWSTKEMQFYRISTN